MTGFLPCWNQNCELVSQLPIFNFLLDQKSIKACKYYFGGSLQIYPLQNLAIYYSEVISFIDSVISNIYEPKNEL